MKRFWTPSELAEHWTLSFDELSLLAGKNKTARLGFCLQLKFYQQHLSFPSSAAEFSSDVVDYVASQLKGVNDELSDYDWSNRTARRHRQEIQAHLGFSSFTDSDEHALRQWLSEEVLPGVPDDPVLSEHVLHWLRRNKVRPPGAVTLTRIVASAEQEFESTLFSNVSEKLDNATRGRLDAFLQNSDNEPAALVAIKKDPGRIGLSSVMKEIDKLDALRQLGLSQDIVHGLHPKLRDRYRQRTATESAWHLRRRPSAIRHALLVFYCVPRVSEIVDGLIDLLIQVVHGMGARAERKVSKELLADIQKVRGKTNILYRIAEAALGTPEGRVRDVIFPVASERTIEELVREFHANGPQYKIQIHKKIRGSYGNHYRRIMPAILAALEFRSNNTIHRPVLDALEIIRKHREDSGRYYDAAVVPVEGVIQPKWKDVVIEAGPNGDRISRINYEICVLRSLRERLRCKEIWVSGADRYRNPDEDLPSDFGAKRAQYYAALQQPMDADGFIDEIRTSLTSAIRALNAAMPSNPSVRLSPYGPHPLSLSPLPPQVDPPNLNRLKQELSRRWPMTGLIDVLKETDLRVGFTEAFSTAASREVTERDEVQRRLLLALYGLGTNTGLKRVSGDRHGITYKELLNIRRRYINKASLRDAVRRVVNGIFSAREAAIWGDGTTACASDSKKFGAWDQNLMTEWHIRYGGRGVMIYWHVEKKSTCIYSQLKRCSSSEVAAMIEGVLRHCTDMEVRSHYVDSHGQSEVAFAFCHLLGFDLMPRLKAISKQKLYLPDSELRTELSHLSPILTRPIDWVLIAQQYDEMIKYATALREGSAEPEAILRRFTKSNVQHPTYRALTELGKAIKTLFLCGYLADENLRREIQEGLNVVENWNSANAFIFFGKGGEVATNRLEDQEVSVLALHLLQVSMVYVNTLMLQKVLAEPGWHGAMEARDYKALSPLVYGHVNPYGIIELDMTSRIPLAA